jgi:digeranylgeranylglycerophospholipid reductase
MLLAGDAAGQINPLTGAGIAPAVICGSMAGKWAGRAAVRGDMSLLSRYDKEWRRLYEDSLCRALAARKEIEKKRDDAAYLSLMLQGWGIRQD